MTTLLLNEAELSVELNRLIATVLDTRKKLLTFSLRAGTRAVGFIARNSAAALARAGHELSELIRRLGGRPTAVAPSSPDPWTLSYARDEDLLVACEQAVAEVACQYRDALEWNLPDPAHEMLMCQFRLIIASYQNILRSQRRLRALWSARAPHAAGVEPAADAS